MDAATLTNFLAPFLPSLLKPSPQTTHRAIRKFGANDWSQANALWETLSPKVEADEGLKAAVDQVAAKPDSEIWRSALSEELDILLQTHPDLAAAIASIMQGDFQSKSTLTAGERITAAGGTGKGGMVMNLSLIGSGIVVLGAVAWLLGVRVTPQGISISPDSQPPQTSPSVKP